MYTITEGAANAAIPRPARTARRPTWGRLAVILATGALALAGTLALLPKPNAGAVRAAGSLVPVRAHRGAIAHGPSSLTLPVPTSTTVPAPAAETPAAPAPAAPAPSPTGSTGPGDVAQPVAPSQTTAAHAILPPQEPTSNLTPQPNFLNSCSGSQYDDSTACVGATLAAIAVGRRAEGLPAMTLPGDWGNLSPEEQLFVATNLERTARGLPALGAMVSPLDLAAAAGAASNVDPSPPSGFGFAEWGSNWAGAVGNPLEAIYYWMYDDGPGSSNIDCTSGDSSGCWGHRDNVLLQISGPNLVMGIGYAATAYRGSPSWTELLVEATGPSPVDFAG